jgi:hypothetical protein
MNKPKTSRLALAAGAALMLGAGTALAGPGGTYVQGAFADWDDFDSGTNVAGSLRIPGGIRFFADYTDTDLEWLRAGLGWQFGPPGPLGLELGLTYHDFTFDDGTDTFEDDGIGVHGNVRLKPIPGLSFSARAEQIFLDEADDDETVIGLDADWRVLPPFVSLFVSYETFSEADNDLIKVGLRGHFSLIPGL